jgi:NADPH-dependent ferric siderophore reductase
VHVEVTDASDELPLPTPAEATITWHHRTGGFGDVLVDAVVPAAGRSGTHYWIATEAGAVRRIRRLLLDSGIDRQSVTTRGYWRIGEANHPDHDYGDD